MRISTETGSIAAYVGEEEAIRLIAAAGFDHYDVTMLNMARVDYRTWKVIPSGHPFEGDDAVEYAKRLRQLGESLGITCNQTHAPHPIAHPEVRKALTKAIACTAALGASVCVIHPNNNLSPEENAKIFEELLPLAHELNVKIATENMWNWDGAKGCAAPAACSDPASFLAHLAACPDPNLVACLDIGHSEMRGLGTNAPEMIRALGPTGRLAALHLHDNNLRDDQHLCPGKGSIDYGAVLEALCDVDYQGVFTLEAYKYINAVGADDIPARVREMAESAKNLAELFEAIKRERGK